MWLIIFGSFTNYVTASIYNVLSRKEKMKKVQVASYIGKVRPIRYNHDNHQARYKIYRMQNIDENAASIHMYHWRLRIFIL